MKSPLLILAGVASATLFSLSQPVFAQEAAPASKTSDAPVAAASADSSMQDPRLAMIEQQLQQLQSQGASDTELLLIETMAYYQLGMDEQAAAKIAAIEKAIPGIEKQDGVNSENARAARAIIIMADAKKSWDKGDIESAETEIGKAFVQMPEIANGVAGQWVNDYWQAKLMDGLTVPMDKPLGVVSEEGKTVTLADLAKG